MKSKRKCSDFIDNINNLGIRLDANNQYGSANLSDWLLKNLKIQKGERVLDLGCGNGTYLKKIASIIGQENLCFGIDYDAEMIKKSKKNSQNDKLKVKFFHLDMDLIGQNESPFQDDFFDLIYSVYAFYYSKNEFQLLNSLKRKLKPTGRIVIVGPYSDNNKGWFDFLNQFMQLPSPIIASTTTFMEEIMEYAKENFKNVDAKEFVNNITLPSYEALRNYWVANIYYDPKLDNEFKRFANFHFKKNKEFLFLKKAQMLTMKNARL